MKPLNYTTKVPVAQTVAEVHALLAEAGASAIGTTYTNGKVMGVNFALHGHGYVLPVDTAAMARYLRQGHQRGEITTKHVSRAVLLSGEHAERVAWRVVKDWLEAQLALIMSGQALPDQVMLPYVVDGQGVTLYARWRDQQGLPAIEAGS